MKKLIAIASFSAFLLACGNEREISEEPKEVIESTTEEAMETEDMQTTEASENYRTIGIVHVSETACPLYIEAKFKGGTLNLYPMNLEDKFKRDGMRLKFAYEDSKGASPSNCSVDKVVSLSDVTLMR